jgi:hypothetical protein
MIFSSGPTGVGAYSASGQVVEACPLPANATFESENCDGDTTFHLSDGSNGEGMSRNENEGPDFYDDLTRFLQGPPTRIWTYAKAPNDSSDIVSNTGYIGIGTLNPEVELDVVGNIQAENGDAQAGFLCLTADVTDFDNCFSADAIAGAGIECDSTEGAMTGISQGGTECDLTVSSSGSGVSCPAGQYMTGMDASGGITCATP